MLLNNIQLEQTAICTRMMNECNAGVDGIYVNTCRIIKVEKEIDMESQSRRIRKQYDKVEGRIHC